MSPVGRRKQKPGAAVAVITAVGGVLASVLLMWWLLRLTSSGEVEFRLGDERFNAGKVSRMAPEIDDRGPILYGDVANRDRPIWINHLGDDEEKGWVAFEARPFGAPEDCFVSWDADQDLFIAPCDNSSYPPDGDGLTELPVTVEEGRIIVDVNGPYRTEELDTGDDEPEPDDGVVRSGEPKTDDS